MRRDSWASLLAVLLMTFDLERFVRKGKLGKRRLRGVAPELEVPSPVLTSSSQVD